MAGTLRRLRAIPALSRILGNFEMLTVTNTSGAPAFVPRHEVTTSAAAAAKAKTRASTAYQLFTNDPEVRGRLVKGKMTLGEISKTLSSTWKTLSDAEKQKYTEGAKAAKAEFEAVHGKPKKAEKKPPNAYALFVKENFAAAKGNSNDSAPAVMKKLSHQWKALSAQEKSKYKSS